MCVSFSLCTPSFEQIWTKFDMWHHYTLQMVMGVSERCSSTPHAIHMPLQMSGKLSQEILN